MKRAALVNFSIAVVLAVGSFLQGWVLATLYDFPFSKEVFPWESAPIWAGPGGEGPVWFLCMLGWGGLVFYVEQIGENVATKAGTTDWLGRRNLLINSTLLLSFCSVMILWSTDHFFQLASTMLSAFGLGFSFTLLSTYLLEVVGKGSLDDWLPYVGLCSGSHLCFVVMDYSDWRLEFEVSFVLSLLYLFLIVLILPESPKWLVSKGLLVEAEKVLQALHGREDVSDEMALLNKSSELVVVDFWKITMVRNLCMALKKSDFPGNIDKSVSKCLSFLRLDSKESACQNVTTLLDPLLSSDHGESLTRERDESAAKADAYEVTICIV